MILARHSVETCASPQAIWVRWAEVASWPAWDPALAAATLEGPFDSGSRIRFLSRERQPSEFRIGAFNSGESFTLEASLLGARLRRSHRVEPSALGSRATVQIEIRGWLGWLHAWFLRGPWQAATPVALRGLARAASGLPE